MKTRNDISVDQLNHREELVSELHAKIIQAAVTETKQSIGSLPPTVFNDNAEQGKDNESTPSATEISDTPQVQHNGPDKINEIRNDVAAQSAQLILSPEKQHELMEIVKQKSEEFEKELNWLLLDKDVIDNELRRFKDELTENVSKLLAPFEQSVKNANHIQNETHQ